ncbi:MAG TPA: hypothetical protein VM347_39715 [Nonomuraea sp.]|nr:hypothetical protein [Nonomuraea sp.]
MTRSPATPGGTLVLDSEGVAKAVQRDRTVTTWLALARGRRSALPPDQSKIRRTVSPKPLHRES